jgi:hypothetical protein
MRTAYLTLDEVNAQHAIRLGTRCGQTVSLVDLRSPDLIHEAYLILDLDHLPAEEHPRLFGLLLPRTGGKVAVHAYHLPAEIIRDLMRAGVVVRRRLDATLFRRLHTRRKRTEALTAVSARLHPV